jgi:UDP-3-O-[3-hydroxymyristoyl] glucosamine N-acyltransferase
MLQPNCVIGRATFGGFTKIGAETLIDAGVSISHDCEIGAEVTICANASISGRATVGRGAYIGPNAAISNGVALGDKSVVSIGSVVTRAVAPNTRVTGNFAMPHAKWLALIRKFR